MQCAGCGLEMEEGIPGRPRKWCVECARRRAVEVAKKWARENPGRVRAARQAREAADPEKTAAKRRAKYERVKADPVRMARVLEQQRERRLANPRPRSVPRRAEGTLLECTACRAMLPRGVFENAGGGRPRGRCPECDRGRVVMKRKARGEAVEKLRVDLVAKLREKQTDRWGQLKCALCGRVIGPGDRYHVDHIIPVARGGRHEEGNLQLTHPGCNLRKGARIQEVPRGSFKQPGEGYEDVRRGREEPEGQGQVESGQHVGQWPGADQGGGEGGPSVELGVQEPADAGGAGPIE